MEETTYKRPAGGQRAPISATLLRHRRGGQAIVILAIFMMFLLGLAGIVYDLGFARHEVSRAQRAADAAALAGVVFMPEHFDFYSNQANAKEAAWETAERQGYIRAHVTPAKVPSKGSQLEVDITSVYTAAFMGIFGFSTLPIKVSAIAEYNTPLVMGAPEPYLGVGSALAVQRSGDASMRMQGFWLSIHSPGTPKENGDPFMVKWDGSSGGGYPCCNAQYQPDHDTQGYNYGLYVPDGATANLQIYDAAYQPKPGIPGGGGNTSGGQNPHFDQAHPCAAYNSLPSACSSGNVQDYNRASQQWCAVNNVETGDNQPGAPLGQCDPQAIGATAVYTVYLPDDTPYYFEDDQVANVNGVSGRWVVPPSHLPDPTNSEDINTNTYSQTWTNFNRASNPAGYQISPYNGNHQWRLQVGVPLDNDPSQNGVRAQNNYAIRLKTNYANVQVYAIQRLPVLATIPQGQSTFYLANVPVEDAGKTLVVSLFDPGDANGNNSMQLLGPPSDAPVFFNSYVHDNRVPPRPDVVVLNTDRLDTTRPAHDTNDKWIDIIYKIPTAFPGGYFKVQYNFGSQTQDRTAWRISIRGNPVHIVLGGS